MSDYIQNLLNKLQKVKSTGKDRWMACCPAHEDENPSMSVKIGDQGQVLLYCFHGCTYEQILKALGLESKDLRPPGSSSSPQRRQKIASSPSKASRRDHEDQPSSRLPSSPAMTRTIHTDYGELVERLATQVGGRLAHEYIYLHEDGTECFRVVRFDLDKGGKTIRPVSCVPGGWVTGDPPDQELLPLYNLPALPKAEQVFVVEGEKCADAAMSVELTATTSAHGARSADKTDWAPLAGKNVVICPDQDAAGEKYADDVAVILSALSPPAKVKILRLPGLEEGEDIYDFLERQDAMEPEALRARIGELADQAPTWEPKATEAADDNGPVMICLADVKARKIAWLWPGRVPMGRLTLLVGRPGEGKSFLTTDMASRVSTGTPWPDGSPCPQGSVILISAEDDPGDTIRPRLDAHQADCSKVHLLSAVRGTDAKGNRRDVLFTLADVEALETALEAHPDCKLIVIDPIGSFLGGGTDAHRDNEVRSVLAPVARLAEKYGPAVVIVAHRRKSTGGSADDLAMGSRAFTGVARAVWHLSRDPKDKARRLFLPGKNNLALEGGGLGFTIGGEPPRLVWEHDPITMSADDALAIENGDGERHERLTKAAEWLMDRLKDHQERTVESLKAEAAEAGIPWRSVERAKQELGVRTYRSRFRGGCVWQLPRLGTPYSPPNGENGESGEYGENGENEEKRGKDTQISLPESHTRQAICVGEHVGDIAEGDQ